MTKIDIKFDQITDLYDLFSGKKEALILEQGVDTNLIYHEAYEESQWVQVLENPQMKTTVVVLDKTMTALSVSHQLIGTLLYGENEFVTYKGEHNLTSIRAAAYKNAKNLETKVRVSMSLGMVYMSLKKDPVNLAEHLDTLTVGESATLPLSLYPSAEKFRSALQSYSLKNEVKFITRVRGKDMLIVRVEEAGGLRGFQCNKLKAFIETMQWDLPYPIDNNQFAPLSPDRIKSNAYRYGKGTISLVDGVMTKHKFKVVRSDGCFEVLVYGQCVYKCPIATFCDADKFSINRILEPHGVKYEDLN